MIWDEFLRHFRFCDEEDSGLSDEEQTRTPIQAETNGPTGHVKRLRCTTRTPVFGSVASHCAINALENIQTLTLITNTRLLIYVPQLGKPVTHCP
ncbi:hypothetical protein [Bacteroides sp. An51A]|uniref:hypothetical protein n=1 Tax=Bacteroides sp. An51A TaxID=1965640 RepID=UPI00117898C5|nr:hypothetical protein [Bacteroides sp. An51A]